MGARSERTEKERKDGAIVIPLPATGPTAPTDGDQAAAPPAAHEREDPVTGLDGATRFRDHLRGAARRRRGDENPWVALAGIEGLAEVNDRFGRGAGDELLRTVAFELRTSLREGDKLARLGGGEFGIVIDAPHGDEATAAFERLVRRVRGLAACDRRWQDVSLSVGVAPIWSENPTPALASAQEALQRARHRGGELVMMSTTPGPPRPTG